MVFPVHKIWTWKHFHPDVIFSESPWKIVERIQWWREFSGLQWMIVKEFLSGRDFFWIAMNDRDKVCVLTWFFHKRKNWLWKAFHLDVNFLNRSDCSWKEWKEFQVDVIFFIGNDFSWRLLQSVYIFLNCNDWSSKDSYLDKNFFNRKERSWKNFCPDLVFLNHKKHVVTRFPLWRGVSESQSKTVVYKLEFDAKSRGRSVHIEFYRKVISHKRKKTSILNSTEKWFFRKSKKLYYINGGMKI